MYEFDIVFLDVTSPGYYDKHTLETRALGGTEASVIRVAEALAGFGLRVAVVQAQGVYFEPAISQFAYYFHGDDLGKIKCKHFVQIRGIGNSHLFPKAKKYIWLHDEATEKIKDWNDTINEQNMKVVGVSRWHKKDIEKYILSTDVSYIYNPVPDEIYVPEDVELAYDKNLFVWAASPHKGLTKALEVFKEVKRELPDAKLMVSHPGYMKVDITEISTQPGVSVMSPMACKQLWSVIQQSLCTFYPSTYNETFCCILAESNALGTPMLGYSRQVLKEVSTGELVEPEDTKAIVAKAVDWHTNGKPKVRGNPDFKISKVVFKWLQLFGG